MRNDYRLPIGEAMTTASDKRTKMSGQRRTGTNMGVGVRRLSVQRAYRIPSTGLPFLLLRVQAASGFGVLQTGRCMDVVEVSYA